MHKMSRLSKPFCSAREFERLFHQHHIPTSTFEKISLSIRNGFTALLDPKRGDCVAACGDTLGKEALKWMHQKMRSDAVGREILSAKPLIEHGKGPFAIDYLKSLPAGTVGHCYGEFVQKFANNLNDREPVHYIDDLELAYVMTRYRQLHDIMHVAYNVGVTVEAEVALKWIELAQTRLPVTLLAAFLGSFAFSPQYEPPIRELGSLMYVNRKKARSVFDVTDNKVREEASFYSRRRMMPQVIAWATSAASKVTRPMFLVYLEKWVDQPMDEFRQYCGIEPPPANLIWYLK